MHDVPDKARTLKYLIIAAADFIKSRDVAGLFRNLIYTQNATAAVDIRFSPFGARGVTCKSRAVGRCAIEQELNFWQAGACDDYLYQAVSVQG
jgi:hypothetical protein